MATLAAHADPLARSTALASVRHRHILSRTLPLSVAVPGAAAVLGSLAALATPLSLHVADSFGRPVACGTALRVDHTLAAAADITNAQLANRHPGAQPTNWVAECDGLVAAKRAHAMPVAAIGVTLLVAAAITPTVRSGTKSRSGTHAPHEVAQSLADRPTTPNVLGRSSRVVTI